MSQTTIDTSDDQTLHVRDISVVSNTELRRVIGASCLGNLVEWFDLSIYGFLAIIIGKQFFTAAPDSAQTILALITFSIPFLVRPLGAFIFGYFGDKYGRKHVLAATILLISLSTCSIGLIPTYDSIGMAAPILILVAKVIQGLSVGGEYAGAMTFVSEYSPDRKRGFMASWLDVGSVGGFLVGTMAVFIVTNAVGGSENMEAWGWRIPFFLSLPLGLIGLYLRKHVDESPSFQREGEKREGGSGTLREVLKGNMKAVILCCCLVITMNVAYYTILVYMPTYLAEVVKVKDSEVEIISTYVMVGMMIIQPCFGFLSDKIGRRPFIIIGSIGYFFLSIPGFYLLQEGSPTSIYFGLVILTLLVCCFNSVMAAILPAMFPPEVRLRTLGVSFNISILIAGLTPPVAAYLVGSQDAMAEGIGHFIPYAPAFYLMGISVLGFIAGVTLRERAGKPLKGDLPIASTKQEARELFQEHLDYMEERIGNLSDKISELEEKRQDLIDKHPNIS